MARARGRPDDAGADGSRARRADEFRDRRGRDVPGRLGAARLRRRRLEQAGAVRGVVTVFGQPVVVVAVTVVVVVARRAGRGAFGRGIGRRGGGGGGHLVVGGAAGALAE